MMRRQYKRENWMEDSSSDMLDVPAIDAIVKEINSKYKDIFDTISVRRNEIIMHLDNADAELHIKTSGTYCESYLVMPLTNKHIETKQDVRRFVDNTICNAEDIVD